MRGAVEATFTARDKHATRPDKWSHSVSRSHTRTHGVPLKLGEQVTR